MNIWFEWFTLKLNTKDIVNISITFSCSGLIISTVEVGNIRKISDLVPIISN